MEYVLLVGLAAVLIILLVLIRVVSDYGKSVRSMQSRLFDSEKPLSNAIGSTGEVTAYRAASTEDGIPGEVVAAISAAIYCMYPGATVKLIRRSVKTPQSAWKKAGLLESTRPF